MSKSFYRVHYINEKGRERYTILSALNDDTAARAKVRGEILRIFKLGVSPVKLIQPISSTTPQGRRPKQRPME